MYMRSSVCLLMIAITTNSGKAAELPSRLPAKLTDVVETVIERDAAGVIRKERQVTLDADLNFINHGSYREFDEKGQLVQLDHFKAGLRHGERQYYFSEIQPGSPLVLVSDGSFKRPYVAQATYVEGKIDGVWTIQDAEERLVFECHYVDGQCHGTTTWWYPNGQKRVAIDFEYGVAVGSSKFYNKDGKLTNETKHVNGRPLLTTVGHHKDGSKAFEGTYLGQVIPTPTFAWWEQESTKGQAVEKNEEKTKKKNEETNATLERHGTWTTWYPNGTLQTRGEFIEGLPHGRYQWWYETGQQSTVGYFERGQSSGQWVKWHPNGMRKAMLNYKDGSLVGEWMRWDEQGRLVSFALGDDAEQSQPQQLAPNADETVGNETSFAAERADEVESSVIIKNSETTGDSDTTDFLDTKNLLDAKRLLGAEVVPTLPRLGD